MGALLTLMSPKALIAIALAAALAFSHFFVYRAGSASVREKWDAAIAAQQAQAMEVERDNRKLENKRQTNVIEAQNAQVKRTQVLQNAVAGARSELDGLRGDIAASRITDMPSAPGDASGNPGGPSAGLLAECAAAYQELAAKADGHNSDSLMYQQAWPR